MVTKEQKQEKYGPLIMGHPALNVDGVPMIVTERFALYRYDKTHFQVISFRNDGSEVGSIKTLTQTRRILTTYNIPNVAEQRNYALKYKLILE